MSRLNTIDKAMICFNVQLVKILQCKITVCKVIIVFSRGGILITSLHIIALLRKVFFRCIIIFFRTFEQRTKYEIVVNYENKNYSFVQRVPYGETQK